MWSYRTCSNDTQCLQGIQEISSIHEKREVESFYSGVFSHNEATKTLLLALCVSSAVGYGSMFLMIYSDKKLQAHPMRLFMYGALLGCIIFTQFTFMGLNPFSP